MHLSLPAILPTPSELKESLEKLLEDDVAVSPVLVDSPQHTVVVEPDQAAPGKVHETDLFLKELESLRSLVMSLHHLQLSMQQENLDTRELLLQQMSVITQDVQALKGQKAAVLSSSAKCLFKAADEATEADGVYGTYEGRVSHYLRGMEEASRVSSPISRSGECKTTNAIEELPTAIPDHTSDMLSVEETANPHLEDHTASDPQLGDMRPALKMEVGFNTELLETPPVEYRSDVHGHVAHDTVIAVVHESLSVIETSGAPDHQISARSFEPQPDPDIGVLPFSPPYSLLSFAQDRPRHLRSRSPPCRPLSSSGSHHSLRSTPAPFYCSPPVRPISPGINDIQDYRGSFLFHPIHRNPSRGRTSTRGTVVENPRSRSCSCHHAEQECHGTTLDLSKAIVPYATTEGTGSDVMPHPDRSYSRSKSRPQSGESYRMRMRSLYPVYSSSQSSRNSSSITKKSQIEAAPHLSSPTSWRTRSLSLRCHSPRFMRARSSSYDSSRSSVPTYEACLLPVQHPEASPSPSSRSASVATKKSQIEASPLIKSLTPPKARSVSPTPDSPMSYTRLGVSRHPVYPEFPPNSERELSELEQQYSPVSASYIEQSCHCIFDSPLALDAVPSLVPTYNQINISPSRITPSQSGQLDEVASSPPDIPPTISANSLGLLPSGDGEDPLKHSNPAMMDLVTRMQSQIMDLTKQISDLKSTRRRSTSPPAPVSGSTTGIIPPTPYMAPPSALPPPVTTLEVPYSQPLSSTSPIPPPPPPVSYGGFSYSGAPLHPNATVYTQPARITPFSRNVPFSSRTLHLGADAPPITASVGNPAVSSAFAAAPPSNSNFADFDYSRSHSNWPTHATPFGAPYAPLNWNTPDASTQSRQHLPSRYTSGPKSDSPSVSYGPNASHGSSRLRLSASGPNVPRITLNAPYPWFPHGRPPMTFETFRHEPGPYGQATM